MRMYQTSQSVWPDLDAGPHPLLLEHFAARRSYRRSSGEGYWPEWALAHFALGLAHLTGWSHREAITDKILRDLRYPPVAAQSGTFKRTLHGIEESGLVEVLRCTVRGRPTHLWRLRPLGRNIMTQVTGQQGTEDEWTRMKQHKGDAARQIRHLAATCTFAWLARNWGYETTVLPRPGATPEFDILLENYYRRHMPRVHVEVQGLHGDPEKRKRKWRAMAKAQGRVAICTERMRDAEDLGHEAWSVTGRRVVVASLDALLRARESQDFRPNNLWVLTL